MAVIGELNSVQAPLVEAMKEVGWTYVPGHALDRAEEQPFVESEVIAALSRLNPAVGSNPVRVDEVMGHLRALTLATANDGLVETNREFTRWLRGLHTHTFDAAEGAVPVRLIDFEDLRNNTFVVSDEVRFGVPGHIARFDLVLWVNGFPLVVGELKTPTAPHKSWVNGANEITQTYVPGWPEFFVPNVVVFASEGKEFMYGGLGSPSEFWETWGPNSEQALLADVIASAKDMLAPATVLDLLHGFAIFEAPKDNSGATSLNKIVARYPQYEAVNLLVERALDPERNRGLVFHTQGSGKTIAMVLAAARMLTEPGLANPTIVLVADRVQLVRQTYDQFRSAGMPRLDVPRTSKELRRLLAAKDRGGQDRRGLIFATVHKFAGSPVLNERDNIVVMVDEAHRTQEGELGLAMRAALPNANLFAFTGTPLAKLTRNTFETFGDPGDAKRTLHTYTSDQSIADGMTVPIHVAPRAVEFRLDKDKLDEAFAALAAEEGLDEEEADKVVRRASKVSTFFGNPERVKAVCADIVDHFYKTIDPSGMKAQVVVFDRAACVAYVEELQRLLDQRGDGDEAAVVMTVGTNKGDDPEWEKYHLSESQEEALLNRFRTLGDPLKFLVCTAKLGTGFDAPIEGVLYLDKPLREHTLFQTITRANRNWTNTKTDKAKRYGTIVDYVGLGDEFQKAMTPADGDAPAQNLNTGGLISAFEAQLATTLLRFAGIDRKVVSHQTLMDAQGRLPDEDARDQFGTEFRMLEDIWETIAPDPGLRQHRPDFKFAAEVYASIQPSTGKDALIWQRLGPKTLALVHEHMSAITVTHGEEVVAADADTIRKLVEEGTLDDPQEAESKSAAEIIESIAENLKKAMTAQTQDHPVYKSLGERLDKLREKTIADAQQSIDWLREAFQLAKDVTAAEKAEQEHGVEGLDLLPDPNIGALTQIFNEFAPDGSPEIIGRVVHDIDEIVKQVTADNSGWASTQKGDRLVRQHVRTVMKTYRLHAVPGLFEKAYAYIAEHY